MIELVDEDIHNNLELADSLASVAVVEIYSPSCMPCRKMMMVLEQIEKEYGEKVSFFKVNATENPKLVERFNVMSLPTIVILTEDSRTQFTGIVSKTKIMEAIG